jgi:large conductance mechanosensitive channel
MTGFKNFIMKGNLVELAVAFIMATAFAAVVTATVALIMDLIGKVGGTPNFSSYEPGGVSVGAWLTALISFLIMAAVVYFLIVLPFTKARDRFFPKVDEEDAGTPADVVLLQEIRDLLEAQVSGRVSPKTASSRRRRSAAVSARPSLTRRARPGRRAPRRGRSAPASSASSRPAACRR